MKRELYFSNEFNQLMNVEIGNDEAFSQRVGFLASAAIAVSKQYCPHLAIGEWCAIAEALNGYFVDYQFEVASIFRHAWGNVSEGAQELDRKWSVDCSSLANRLDDLPLVEQFAVFEIAKKFWDEGHKDATYIQIFTKLGAPGLN